mgnify:CR=1 FL=1
MCIFVPFLNLLISMTMKQTRLALGLFLMTAVGFSCSNDGKIIERLQLQNDSLSQVSLQQQDVIDGLASTMEEITLTMDTIASQERFVLSGVDERGVPLTKRNMRAKLEALSNLIKDQHGRLDSLGKALEGSNATVAKLRGVVNLLTKSLDERTRELDSLRTVLAYKDININQLGTQVANLTDTVNTVKNENASQKQTIAKQEQNIAQQDTQLHEVYYIIGTKDELMAAGVLVKQGGLFKKKKVNFDGMNKSALKKGDIRTLKTINIPSKNAKILGEVPETSYTMTQGESASRLDITNPTRFWSSNNRVLVIQVK